jgi:adenosylhomocysteine nucleosidase
VNRFQILIASALREEVAPLDSAPWTPLPGAQVGRWPVRRWEIAGGEVVSVATGVGAAACSDALIAVDARLHFSAILSVGFAGALVPDLAVGDICVAETICAPGSASLRPHESSLETARTAAGAWSGRPWRFGVGLTSETVLSNAEAKETAAKEHGAQWVDMESIVAARLASRFAIPWLAIRAISDTLSDDLSLGFEAMRSQNGRTPATRGLLAMLARPSRFAAAMRLRRQTQAAAREICRALEILAPLFFESLRVAPQRT